jgi:hypothetical protein
MSSRDIKAQRLAKEALRRDIDELGPDAEDQAEDDDGLDAAWFDQQWESPWAQQEQQR